MLLERQILGIYGLSNHLMFLHGRRRLRYVFRMGLPRLSIIFGAAPAVLVSLMTLEARAANNAYAVDAADISEVGSCKVESWISNASNTDFSAVANPSCVVDLFKPVELSLLTNP